MRLLARIREMSHHDGESMLVQSLWRYPVKSLQGESCVEVELDAGGVRGDRAFGILDLESGTILSAKREGRLLEASASLALGTLSVILPGGETYVQGEMLDEQLTRWLGRRVRLIEAANFETPTFEGIEDYERDDSPLVRWQGRRGSFVDSSALHVLTSGIMDQLSRERPDIQWDVRRFRPNVMVDGGPSYWATRRIRVGEAEIEFQKGCTRCVMTTRSQPGGLERQLDVLRHVARSHDNVVGELAAVEFAGTVRVGDTVVVL
jgi:uncharacterized protein YcbX